MHIIALHSSLHSSMCITSIAHHCTLYPYLQPLSLQYHCINLINLIYHWTIYINIYQCPLQVSLMSYHLACSSNLSSSCNCQQNVATPATRHLVELLISWLGTHSTPILLGTHHTVYEIPHFHHEIF